MSQREVEAHLMAAKAALAKAHRALPREARRNPEASVKWRVEQGQRDVQAALDHYHPVTDQTED